jgi:PhnB protein
MANQVKSKPDGYHNISPYLIVKGAAAAIEFYKKVFGASEIMRMPQPDGRIGHAELKIGDSVFMLADEHIDSRNKTGQNGFASKPSQDGEDKLFEK